jgi:putative phage-type endonuclease
MDVLAKLTNCKVFSTVSQETDENEWLAARSRGIGGSDVGAICGVSEYSSARLIYLKKTGQYEESIKSNEASRERMHFGHMLEPIVADEFARRTGKKIAVSPATLVHKDHPWALANIDRFIVDDEGNPIGVLECKTASEYMNDSWDEGALPMSYIYQLNWYLWITGLEYGAFACLVGGNKFYYYEVFRNDDLLNAVMIPTADRFWNYHVKNLVQPELSGSGADTEYVAENNKEVVKNSEITLSDDVMDELADTVIMCKAKIKELEKTMEEAANRIKDKMRENEIGYTSNHVVKWSPRKQTRVDTETLKTKYPEIYKNCVKEINFRVFTIK